jgi:hypothetical protein
MVWLSTENMRENLLSNFLHLRIQKCAATSNASLSQRDRNVWKVTSSQRSIYDWNRWVTLLRIRNWMKGYKKCCNYSSLIRISITYALEPVCKTNSSGKWVILLSKSWLYVWKWSLVRSVKNIKIIYNGSWNEKFYSYLIYKFTNLIYNTHGSL